MLDLRRCCLRVSVDPRWSQNSTEHISPLGVFTHTFRHTQIFGLILLTVGSPEPRLAAPLQDFCSTGTVKRILRKPGEARYCFFTYLDLSAEKNERKTNSPAGTAILQEAKELECLWVSFASEKKNSKGGKEGLKYRKREGEDGKKRKDLYAPLHLSFPTLQILHLGWSTHQLVPIQHIQYVYSELSSSTSLPLGGAGEEILFLFLTN